MRAIAATLLLLALAGCTDPFDRPLTWSLPPTGLSSNDNNLRAMLVNPGDAVAGVGEDTSVAPLSERPVELLMSGHRRPLPFVNASEVGAGQQQQQQQQQQQPGMGGAGGGAGPQQ
jgi:hypothetical protein